VLRVSLDKALVGILAAILNIVNIYCYVMDFKYDAIPLRE